MWLYRLKRLMIEREVLIGLGILGFTVMLANLLDDLALSFVAAIIQSFGLFLLVLLLIWEFGLRSRFQQPLPVPLMFTEMAARDAARTQFNTFVQACNLTSAAKVLESLCHLQDDDLTIHLKRNPRDSSKLKDWRSAWQGLLHEWEHEVDRRLFSQPFVHEGRCYHIFPNVVLPLAFALGASADLRQSVVLYHYEQPQRFCRVLNLIKPRSLFQEPDSAVPPPQSIPEDLNTLPQVSKLILHLVISARHPVELDKHPDHAQAANAALNYRQDLNPEVDWLPYVQWLVQKAQPLIAQYPQVEVCLVCPSVVAFALGMAFSRMPHVTVCHWLNGQYQPVFSLTEIERHLPFH